ncbi:MAG TPA: hypothetical protein VF728_02675, partial [Nocardioides sp.]
PVDLADLQGRPVTAEVLAEATERIMVALTHQLEGLRGESAPEGRYDPREHGITVTGRPRAVTPSERSDTKSPTHRAQWADDHPDDVEDHA